MASSFQTWFKVAFQVRGSILTSILPQALLFGGFGVLISGLYQQGIALALPRTLPMFVVEGILGGLLLIWLHFTSRQCIQGQQQWQMLMNTTRNLSRQMWLAIEEKEVKDRTQKVKAMMLLVAFAVALKLHLRGEPIHSDRNTPNNLQDLLSGQQYKSLTQLPTPPLEIAFWLGDYLQMQYERERLNLAQLTTMQAQLSNMIDILGHCEQLVTGVMPKQYSTYLRQLLLIYCTLLPFQLVDALGWGTGPVVILIAITLLGTEALGHTIDIFNPSPSALPLDTICTALHREVTELTTRPPHPKTSIKTSLFHPE
ncbi:MAG: hypothetical protein F6K16_34800 [Symploca sp. SIO2B6]|nr:hypothetical protein [Symploca sp. SIO2B6]